MIQKSEIDKYFFNTTVQKCQLPNTHTHMGEVKSFVPHHLENLQSVSTLPPQKHAASHLRGKPTVKPPPLPPSVRALYSRKSFGRSKRALPSKKQAVGPCRKWQHYLHAIFHLIIPNVDTARLRSATIHQGVVSHLFALISCDMTSCGC